MRVQEPVADSSGKLVAVIALDQRHHHVERGDAARTGDAIAVDLKQRRCDLDVGEVFAEGGLMLPMQRRPVLVEESGARENVGDLDMPPMVIPRRASRRSQAKMPRR